MNFAVGDYANGVVVVGRRTGEREKTGGVRNDVVGAVAGG